MSNTLVEKQIVGGITPTMSTEAIVTKLMELVQSQIAESSGKSLSEKEERALAIGHYASELAMSETLETDPDEAKCIICKCNGIAISREKCPRHIVTLAGNHKIIRRKYRYEKCGEWIVPRDAELGIGSGFWRLPRLQPDSVDFTCALRLELI